MAQVPERLNLEQCAELLGIERGELRAHMGNLVQHAAGRDRLGRPFWHLEDAYRWAARTLPATSNRIPVTFWPKADAPAEYLGARAIGTAAAALGWATQCGDLWVAWDYPSDLRRTFPAALSLFPSAAAITVIGGDFGRTGPAVWAILPGSPDEPHYETQWRHLSDVLRAAYPVLAIPTADPGAGAGMAAESRRGGSGCSAGAGCWPTAAPGRHRGAGQPGPANARELRANPAVPGH